MNLKAGRIPIPRPLVLMLIAIPTGALLAVFLFIREMNESISGQITIPVIIGLLLIVTTGLLITFLLWDQWRRFYHEKYEMEPFRREAKLALERSHSLLLATLESTADGLLVVDFEGNVILYNRKFIEMWKIPEELIESRKDILLLEYVRNQLKNPEDFVENIKSLYRDPKQITYDYVEFVDGRCFARYSQPQVINGEGVGRVWSFRDITFLKKTERDLISAKEKAEESDRLKTAFLHNVSHEIRTPMNAIIGFSTLLNEPEISDQERCQYAGVIYQSGNQLLSIINDIVDIANIESGQVKPNFSETNINHVLRNLVEQFSYKKNDIVLELQTELSDEDAFITTDNTKLIQILSNLIGNSLKFTSEGKIKLGYTLQDSAIEFYVSDTGIGIPEDQLEKIFERFYQVNSSSNRSHCGTGLGLSICKAYVGLLGGRIYAESKLEHGATFRFTIPILRAGCDQINTF
ncbi:MAG TPA: ATP-binding protein [Bacteroidales bacterium]|nr:ATP-binding protein [Bacteroidales bacterium]